LRFPDRFPLFVFVIKKVLCIGRYRSSDINIFSFLNEKGGLGVVNLQLQNEALLLKQLDKFYQKKGVQWVRLVWDRYYLDGVPHLRREKGSF